MSNYEDNVSCDTQSPTPGLRSHSQATTQRSKWATSAFAGFAQKVRNPTHGSAGISSIPT